MLAAVAALVLLVSLFLDWYEPGFSAWTVFEFLDLLLALIALAAIVALVDALGVRVARGLRGSRLALPLGLAAFVVVVSQLLNDPPAVVGGGNDHAVGIWLALGGSALMVLGALLSVARISVAFDTSQGNEGPGKGDRSADTTVREPGRPDAPTGEGRPWARPDEPPREARP